jgi:hypothetical protein
MRDVIGQGVEFGLEALLLGLHGLDGMLQRDEQCIERMRGELLGLYGRGRLPLTHWRDSGR